MAFLSKTPHLCGRDYRTEVDVEHLKLSIEKIKENDKLANINQ